MLSENRQKSLMLVTGAVVATILGGYCFLASKAKAADKGGVTIDSVFADAPVAPPKSGVFAYFGVHGGRTMFDTEVSLSGVPLSFDGVGGKGWIGGLEGGVDYVFASRMFVGAWASYSWQNTESKLTLGTTTLSAGLGDSYAVGGRFGYDMGKAKLYGLAGYRHTDVEWPSGATGLPSSLSGLDLGIGAGVMLNKNLELDVKGIWTKYQDEDIGKGIGHPVLSTDQLQILTSLNFKF